MSKVIGTEGRTTMGAWEKKGDNVYHPVEQSEECLFEVHAEREVLRENPQLQATLFV